jgi:hypothetical protein
MFIVKKNKSNQGRGKQIVCSEMRENRFYVKCGF